MNQFIDGIARPPAGRAAYRGHDRVPARIPPRRPARREVTVTGVGLRIPDALDFGLWEQVGHKIAHAANCSAWCLGDWLVYGQYRYTERYRTVVAAVDLDYQTLRNYAWVARSFEIERRRPTLSFQHHAEVAAAFPEEQDRWLDLAQAGRWSRNELRRRVRADREGRAAGSAEPGRELGVGADTGSDASAQMSARMPGEASAGTGVGPGPGTGVGAGADTVPGPAPEAAALLPPELSPDRLARWRDAARLADRELADWVVATLDDGATQLLR